MRIKKGPTTESVVFFSKHDVLNILAVHQANVYLIKGVLYTNWPFGVALYSTLYNHFCVLSFHSVLCFPNDYHMVKEE